MRKLAANNLGLRESDLLAIRAILNGHPEVERAFVFGSRAKGSHKNGSDVDLALKGHRLTFADVSRISYELNETTNMPYRFDVLGYETIQTAALKEHIDRVGAEVYDRREVIVEYNVRTTR